jgi:type IV secretory pathway VirJ component
MRLTLLVASLWLTFAFRCEAQTISHGRFQHLTIYQPQGEARQVVLFFSGDSGWNTQLASAAQALAGEGTLVAGINAPAFFADLERDAASCLSPDGDLENLSHFLQAYYRLPAYRAPILAGYASGATFVYAMIAQAPAGTFAGAVSLAFRPHLPLKKPLCPSGNLHTAARKDQKGVDLSPAGKLDVPWIVLQGQADGSHSPEATRSFVTSAHGGELIVLPEAKHTDGEAPHWLPQLSASVRKIAAQGTPVLVAPQELKGLPIIEVPAKSGNTDVLAVLISGDGGWAGIDKKIAATLSSKGIGLVGVDSLRYFWSARTPQSTAADLDRILRYYLVKWRKRQVLLIGYSQGADVLPFVVNRLPPQTRSRIRLAALLGPGHKAQFEFHLANWLNADAHGLPIRPEIERVATTRLLCIYGSDETDSLCPTLSKSNMHIVKLSGGHHFDGDYQHLATLLIAGLTAP